MVVGRAGRTGGPGTAERCWWMWIWTTVRSVGRMGCWSDSGPCATPVTIRQMTHAAGVLAITAAAVLAGARSYTAIAEFAREVPQATLARLGIWRRPYSDW
jgi:hypothetical protein